MINSDDKIIILTNRQGMVIKLSNYGATWLSCLVPLPCGNKREVLLGCKNLADYKKQNAYLGAVVGRYANRIANAKISLENHIYQLIANQEDNQLHGGLFGFDKHYWNIIKLTQYSVSFQLLSPHGDQGFPGNLLVTVTYTLDDNNQVQIDYQAKTDLTTPVNLTNHAYFNLDGDNEQTHDARKQYLQINADYYLPVGQDGLPLNGKLVSVEQDDMDLRSSKQLFTRFLDSFSRQLVAGYDHAYLLDKTKTIAARLTSSDNTLAMVIETTKPAIQVYSGNYLQGVANRSGKIYSNYAGIALETQFLPDSPNHPHWPQPNCWLHPNETYQHQTTYRFIHLT